MKKEIKFRRSGDINLHSISQEEFNNFNGQIIENNGVFVLAKGEATGSFHKVKTATPFSLIIKEDELGNRVLKVKEEGVLTHTADHETIKILPGFYRQSQERELDYFANSVVKKVVD